MSVVERNLGVALRRANLDDLPGPALPPGYRATWYAPGDEALWVDIHQQAERFFTVDLALYWREFGARPAELPARQLFLRDAAGAPVGTATAWYGDPSGDERVGRVHWVAIVPAHQGRGLAKPLLAQVCRRLRELGHTSAFLDTSTARVPAINLYRQFGFAPDIATPEDAATWQELMPFLK